LPRHGAAGQAVIFDLDGVLIDSETLQYRAYCSVLERFGIRVERDEYATHWIAAGRGPEYVAGRYDLALTPAQLRALKQPIYHDLLRREVKLMPGAAAALARLYPCFPLALATNSGRRDVDFVLEHFDLARYFTAVVTREDYAEAKPAPDAYLTAAARLQSTPPHCLVVEDAHRGILAAHRAGAQVVAVPHDFTRDNDFSLAVRVLNCLDELTAGLVSEILGSPSRTP
jgi:HAD superfamily hydrolase (TIGR01509 family)